MNETEIARRIRELASAGTEPDWHDVVARERVLRGRSVCRGSSSRPLRRLRQSPSRSRSCRRGSAAATV